MKKYIGKTEAQMNTKNRNVAKKDIWSIPNALRKPVENTFLIH